MSRALPRTEGGSAPGIDCSSLTLPDRRHVGGTCGAVARFRFRVRLLHKSPSDPVRRSVMGRPNFRAAAHRKQVGRHRRQGRESRHVSTAQVPKLFGPVYATASRGSSGAASDPATRPRGRTVLSSPTLALARATMRTSPFSRIASRSRPTGWRKTVSISRVEMSRSIFRRDENRDDSGEDRERRCGEHGCVAVLRIESHQQPPGVT